MTGDLLSELSELSRFGSALQSLMNVATDSAPVRAEGFDETRTVSAVIDADGFPERFGVSADWAHRVAADDLGSALTQAYESAMSARLLEWSTALQDRGWTDDIADFQRQMEAQPGGQPWRPASAAADTVPRRPLEELVEDTVSAIDDARAAADEVTAPRTADAEVARGRMLLRLSERGGFSARVDADWAERQSAASLMTHLDQALGILRLKAVRQRERPEVSRRLDGLLDEAMSTLRASPGAGRN